jgi:hypothetical protein
MTWLQGLGGVCGTKAYSSPWRVRPEGRRAYFKGAVTAVRYEFVP